MKAISRTVLATILSAVAGQAMAIDDHVDVKVTGEIVPPACVPAVSGGAVFDYGGIKASSLALDDYTVLPRKNLTLSVSCDSPMKVALKTIDGRADSVITPTGKTLIAGTTTDSDELLGLGMVNNKSIGAYKLILGVGSSDKLMIDGTQYVTGAAIRSSDDGLTWQNIPNKYTSLVSKSSGDRLISFTTDGSTEPTAFTTMSTTIGMQAALNKGSELDLTKMINLDGLATIQVIYL